MRRAQKSSSAGSISRIHPIQKKKEFGLPSKKIHSIVDIIPRNPKFPKMFITAFNPTVPAKAMALQVEFPNTKKVTVERLIR